MSHSLEVSGLGRDSTRGGQCSRLSAGPDPCPGAMHERSAPSAAGLVLRPQRPEEGVRVFTPTTSPAVKPEEKIYGILNKYSFSNFWLHYKQRTIKVEQQYLLFVIIFYQ